MSHHMRRRFRPTTTHFQLLEGSAGQGQHLRGQSTIQTMVRLDTIQPHDVQAMRRRPLQVLHEPSGKIGRRNREADQKTCRVSDGRLELGLVESTATIHLDQEAERRFRGQGYVPEDGDPKYNLFVGTRLIGSSTTNRFVNGTFYTVTGIEPCVVVDDHTGESFETTPEELSKYTQLRWAVTYNKAQGQTLTGSVAMWDIYSQYFTRKHLYVGASRVRDGSLLFVNA